MGGAVTSEGAQQLSALGDLFGRVLGICADAGLVSVGVVAVDGSEFAASALTRPSAATSRSPGKSSRRRVGSTRPRTRSMVPRAATSFPST
jgi:hypothetical protein